MKISRFVEVEVIMLELAGLLIWAKTAIDDLTQRFEFRNSQLLCGIQPSRLQSSSTPYCYFFLICSTILIPLSPGKQVIYNRKIFFTANLENYTNKILFAHSKGYFREFSSFLQCTNLLLVKVSYLNKFKLFYQIYIRLSKVYIEYLCSS